MGIAERREAAQALLAILAALLGSGNATGDVEASASLRLKVGALSANAMDRVEAGDFSSDLRSCFEAAVVAGATFAGMDQVRSTASTYASLKGGVQRVVQTGVRHALAAIARILAQTTFVSRSEVDATIARVNAAFEPAEDFAADKRDNVVYAAAISLHAAVVRDLTARGRPLPRVVAFDIGQRLPALSLSNRLYGDAGRTGELLRENRTVHPLFMIGAGTALAT